MSHYSVAVITRCQPTERLLHDILSPWHEFECTGQDDGYVQNIDKLQEAMDQYSTATATLVIQRPDGTKASAFNDQGGYSDEFKAFYNAETRELKLPEGYVELRDEPIGPYEDFQTWAKGWYGFNVVTDDEPLDLEGRPSVFESLQGRDPERDLGHDSVQVCNIDWAAMLERSRNVLARDWDEAAAKYAAEPLVHNGVTLTFGSALELWAKEFAVHEKAAQELKLPVWRYVNDHLTGEAKELADKMRTYTHGFVFGHDIPMGATTREAYMDTATAISAYAIVQDGQWSENGQMGWFGISSGETMSDEEWTRKTDAHLRGLPGDHHITFVDCHI